MPHRWMIFMYLCVHFSCMHTGAIFQIVSKNDLFESIVEIINGPLADASICIAYDNAFSTQNTDLDFLISRIENNVILFETDGLMEDENSELPPRAIQRSALLILLIGESPDFIPLLDGQWHFDALMIVPTNINLDTREIVQMEIIQKSKDIIVVRNINILGLPSIRMFAAKPFVDYISDPTYFIGVWDKSKYTKYEDIFPKRFKSFEGEVLHIASDVDDFPLVTAIDDRHCGMNLDIVDALSSWLNFSYTTTVAAPEGLWGEYYIIMNII